MKIPEPDLRKARIEIIPMIDTIFFLLVFFLFSTLSMTNMRGINLSLPRPIATVAGPPTREIVVTVSDRGQYAVDKQAVTAQALRASLEQRLTVAPGAVVIVHVADSQPVQSLITVMDALYPLAGPNGQPVPVLVATQKVPAGQGVGHDAH